MSATFFVCGPTEVEGQGGRGRARGKGREGGGARRPLDGIQALGAGLGRASRGEESWTTVARLRHRRLGRYLVSFGCVFFFVYLVRLCCQVFACAESDRNRFQLFLFFCVCVCVLAFARSRSVALLSYLVFLRRSQ